MDPQEFGALTRARSAPHCAGCSSATAAAVPASHDQGLRDLAATGPTAALPAAAALHRVSGTVRRGLESVADVVAPSVLATLTQARQVSALNHLVVVGALSQLARAFDDAGLTWLVMKGPVVAGLYPDVGDRSYADLDLLVAREDYATAIRVLEEHGYDHAIHDWALAESMMAGQVGMSGGRVSIDLHWHLHYSTEDRRPYALDPDAMLRRRMPAAVSGLRVPTLDPVDTVLTLAFHAARSDGHRLMWLKDIERALAVGRPDLDELVRRSRAARCAPAVGMMLSRARRIIDAEIPQEVVRSLAPRSLREADRVVCALQDPVQLHERPTMTRSFTRSVRSSLGASLVEVPSRMERLLRRRLDAPVPTETDSPEEKASYLAAVAAATDR